MAEPIDNNLVDSLAALARSLSGQRDLEGVLRTVTGSAVDLIPGVESADILLISGDNTFESHAPTSLLPVELDRAQERLREGPCVDAAMGAFTTLSDDLVSETRWPRFTPEALDAGVRSILSFQLYTSASTAGALNLFATSPNVFGGESIAVGEAFAAHAAIAIAIAAGRDELKLHSAVLNRDVIGQAKGMMMERFGIPADRAFGMLIKLSQDTGIPLVILSRWIAEERTEPS
ncbi:GAF and ANTAR domain-containing protein [Rhodococcus sp. BL-253-APC-6A1W]|nr:GAF and ANTAR domain-containing protein [Rhodococcus sp. BL-253-APC-6A1W]NMD96621.1 GAF and ANTAR domain-containing protein [Rhodococcus sp. BL-253-APC-6A1W]